MKMWHLIKAYPGQMAEEMLIFEDEETVRQLTGPHAGRYSIMGVFDVRLIEGEEYLPHNLWGEREEGYGQ
jgi:hypothetical protein